MKRGFREAMTWLHSWTGLVLGWVLFAVFLTGSLAVFSPEITRWMQPEARAERGTPQQAITVAQAYLEREAANAQSWSIELPSPRKPVLQLRWINGFDEGEATLDPVSGKVLHPRATEGGDFYNRVHYELRSGMLGLWIVGFAGLGLLVAIVSGVIIHKRIFADLFTFRPWAAAQRAWLDGHNVAGVLVLPFLLMIAYSGVAISFAQFMPASIHALYEGDPGGPAVDIVRTVDRAPVGEPAPLPQLAPSFEAAQATLGHGKVARVTVTNLRDRNAVFEAHRASDDRIAALSAHIALDAETGTPLAHQNRWDGGATLHRSLVGLHKAAFGGPVIAWLYFLSGLIGCALIAAGLTVYVEKRRKKRPQASPVEQRFQRAVESINVAAVSGVVLASIAFLWSSRLIPADLLMREVWEERVFFAAWAAAGVHGALRPPRRAWIEQLAAASVLCVATPVLNAATSQSGLWRAMPAGDWAAVGVDLTAFVIGVALALIAVGLSRRAPA